MKRKSILVLMSILCSILFSNGKIDLSAYRNAFIKDFYNHKSGIESFDKNGDIYNPLLKKAGILDYYCKNRFKNKIINQIIIEVKNDYEDQKLNLLPHNRDVKTAEDIAIFIEKPEHWLNPTIYLSKDFLDLDFPVISSHMIRIYSEYYYYKNLKIKGNIKLNEIRSMIFSINVQAKYLDVLINKDKQNLSEYESYMELTHRVDKPQLLSFFYILYGIDYSNYYDFLQIDSTYDKTKYLEKLRVTINYVNDIIEGKDTFVDPQKNQSLNSYSNYVKLLSLLYHSTLLSEYILEKSDADSKLFKKYIHTLNSASNIIKNNKDEILELKGLFSEKRYFITSR